MGGSSRPPQGAPLTNAAAEAAGRIARRRRDRFAVPPPSSSGPRASRADVARPRSPASSSVSPAPLRRWAREGIVPLPRRPLDARGGRPRPDRRPAARPRPLARRGARGAAQRPARLRVPRGPVPARSETLQRCDEAAESGLEPALIRRIWSASGSPPRTLDERIAEDDVQLLRYIAAVLAAGFPLVAFLQLVRVYGQALAQIADAEVRLFHLYVHEPLIRDGVPGLEIAEEMEGLARDLLPLASPIMEHLHQRFLQHFVEQDVVGHIELEATRRRPRPPAGGDRLRRPRRLHAPDRGGGGGGGRRRRRALRRGRRGHAARRRAGVKTIGDEVMVVGSDRARADRLGGRLPGARGASGRCRGSASTPAPRSTATATTTAREVNLAARVAPARPAARCSSPARRRGGGPPPRVRRHRRGPAEGLPEATELFLGLVDGGGGASASSSACAAGGLLERRRPVVVLLSGGRDSVCLLDLAVRAGADGDRAARRPRPAGGRREDAAFCADLCGRLGVALRCAARARRAAGTSRPGPATPLRAAAARPRRARRSRPAHTATDQVETVLYRLAASPGRRALLGMRPRERAARPPAARGHARGDGGLLRRARGLLLARRRHQRPTAFARNRVRAEARPGAARHAPGGGGQRRAHRRAAPRRGRGPRRAGGRGPDRGRPRWRRCPPRSRGCACSGWPTTPPPGARAGRGRAGHGDPRARRDGRQRHARRRRLRRTSRRRAVRPCTSERATYASLRSPSPPCQRMASVIVRARPSCRYAPPPLTTSGQADAPERRRAPLGTARVLLAEVVGEPAAPCRGAAGPCTGGWSARAAPRTDGRGSSPSLGTWQPVQRSSSNDRFAASAPRRHRWRGARARRAGRRT